MGQGCQHLYPRNKWHCRSTWQLEIQTAQFGLHFLLKLFYTSGGGPNILLFSRSVMSESLPPHGLQHAGLPCPSPSPRVCSNSCPLSWWCHPIISSSVTHFSFSQSFPASGSFPVSQFFTSGGQSIGVSASTSVLPMNIQDWFPLGWTGWIFLQSKGLSRVFSNTTVQSINSSALRFLYSPTCTSIHDYWIKTIAVTKQTFVSK